MKLSRIYHDQPLKPLDWTVFCIVFVMNHKGAKYVWTAIHSLTWCQYHSLDVTVFLLSCVATNIFLVTKCLLFCCQKFGKTAKKMRVVFFFFFLKAGLEHLIGSIWINPAADLKKYFSPVLLGSCPFLNKSSQRSKTHSKNVPHDSELRFKVIYSLKREDKYAHRNYYH